MIVIKREELANQICIVINRYGDFNLSEVRNSILLAMQNYTINEMSTDIVIYDKNNDEAIIQQFFIAKKIKGLSDRTLKLYINELRNWSKRLKQDFVHMTPNDIRIVIANRQIKDKVSAVTINNELRMLGSLTTWMQQEAIRTDNPMLKVDKMKQPKKEKKAFSDMEIEKMRSEIRTNRERAIFETLLSTGCRVTELCNIKISDIDDETISVIGKGNKQRNVYLNAKAKIAIELYLAERKDLNPYLFPRSKGSKELKRFSLCKEYITKQKDLKNWYKFPELVDEEHQCDKGTIEIICRNLGKRSGVRAHPHKFRRTCATTALKRGMPILTVSKMLGHNSLDTTQIYLDISADEVKEAHKKYVI